MDNLAIFTVINYPSKDEFFSTLDILDQLKVGYVEIGIPVIDPYVDGEFIKNAHLSVIQNGFTSDDLRETLQEIKNRYSFKIILMTYNEGIESYGIKSLDHNLYDGIICVDKYLDSKVFNKPIYIFNEELSENELKKYLASNSEFNYVMSGRGKTGSFDKVPTEYLTTIKKIKEIKPESQNFIGFGIKTKKDIDKVISNGADGAIIGTAFIQMLLEKGVNGVNVFLEELR